MRWSSVGGLCVAAFMLVLPAAADTYPGVCVSGCNIPVPGPGPSTPPDEKLGGIPNTEEAQYWAYLDSADALYKRGDYQAALSEVDEALGLRPGDPAATALREYILAAINPPAAPAPAPSPILPASVEEIPAASGLVDQPRAAPPPVPAASPPPPPPKPVAGAVDANGQVADLGLPIPVPEEILSSPAFGEWCKAMAAVKNRDWELAVAWFKQGLSKDPSNKALQRAVDLAAYTLQTRKEDQDISAALATIDLAFIRRSAGDEQGYLLAMALIARHPNSNFEYEDPGAVRWRQAVVAYIDQRSFAALGLVAAQLTQEQKNEAFVELENREGLAKYAEDQAFAALQDHRLNEALLHFRLAASMAPHQPYHRLQLEKFLEEGEAWQWSPSHQ